LIGEIRGYFPVHVSYFLKNVGVKNDRQKVAALVEVSETFVRTWRDKFKSERKISLYTKWKHYSKFLTIFDFEDKILEAKR